jgi:hypothetical protein
MKNIAGRGVIRHCQNESEERCRDWGEKIADQALVALAHQVAEKVTVALTEISQARQSMASEPEFERDVVEATAALLEARGPLQRLASELFSLQARDLLTGVSIEDKIALQAYQRRPEVYLVDG